MRRHHVEKVQDTSGLTGKNGVNIGIGISAIAAILSPTALSIVQAADIAASETSASQTPVVDSGQEVEVQVPIKGSESFSQSQSEEVPVASSESTGTSVNQSTSEETSSSVVLSDTSSTTVSGNSSSNHQETSTTSSSSVEPAETITSEEKQKDTAPAPATTSSKPLDHYSPSSNSNNPVEGEQVGKDGSITFSKNQTTEEFIAAIGEDAREIAGANDLYASVMIAQAILESASGNSQLASDPNYNLFGIKGSYEGASVEFSTQEDNGSGSMYSIQAGFRKYPSYKESLEDYVQLLKGGVGSASDFYHGVWKSNAAAYQDATAFLTGRYATDTQYNLKLNGLIETYDLMQYDQPKPVVENEVVTVQKEKTHVVSNADTLWDIANANDVSVPDLIKWNQLDSGILYEGTQLVVGYDDVEVKKEEVAEMTENQPQAVRVEEPVDSYETHVVEQNKKEATLSTISNVGNRLAKSIGKLSDDSATDNPYQLSASQMSRSDFYKVEDGDTLKSISKKTGIPVKQLTQWNDLDKQILSTGQYLRLSSPDYALS